MQSACKVLTSGSWERCCYTHQWTHQWFPLRPTLPSIIGPLLLSLLQCAFPVAQHLHFANLLRWYDWVHHTADRTAIFPPATFAKPRFVAPPPPAPTQVRSCPPPTPPPRPRPPLERPVHC